MEGEDFLGAAPVFGGHLHHRLPDGAGVLAEAHFGADGVEIEPRLGDCSVKVEYGGFDYHKFSFNTNRKTVFYTRSRRRCYGLVAFFSQEFNEVFGGLAQDFILSDDYTGRA